MPFSRRAVGAHERECKRRHKPATELDMMAETFMIQWLCGVGRFDTNDPCDEWPVP